MTEITIYQAEDGKRFDTKEECQAHEESRTIVDYLRKSDIYEDTMSYEDVVDELLKAYIITPRSL